MSIAQLIRNFLTCSAWQHTFGQVNFWCSLGQLRPGEDKGRVDDAAGTEFGAAVVDDLDGEEVFTLVNQGSGQVERLGLGKSCAMPMY